MFAVPAHKFWQGFATVRESRQDEGMPESFSNLPVTQERILKRSPYHKSGRFPAIVLLMAPHVFVPEIIT
jgi:hypothetical protein